VQLATSKSISRLTLSGWGRISVIGEKPKKHTKQTKPFPLVLTLGLFLMSLAQAAQAVPNGGYAHPEIIIQPEELKVLVEKRDPNIRIVDVREKLQYLSGHIPGAVQVWRPDIEYKNHPIPAMMAPQSQMEALLRNLGIREKNTLIIYSDLYDHARLWWILAYYGLPLKQMKLLGDGIDGWKARGYPTEVVPPKGGETIFTFPKETRGVQTILCTLSDVKSALNKTDKVVLDVRSKEEFFGKEIKNGAARPGRIPGVTWIEWKEVLVGTDPHKNYWKPAEEIKKLYSAKGITPEKDVYLYCHSGVRSAHNLVSLYLVGYPLEKLHNYDGSWIEWSRTEENIETGLPTGVIKEGLIHASNSSDDLS
jgi:thiosulfate/3-mercaptopyruvate sulfurtransferase